MTHKQFLYKVWVYAAISFSFALWPSDLTYLVAVVGTCYFVACLSIYYDTFHYGGR